mmetsp:Transcript_5808/g.5260  ORF Transcript_5808/g.5260 Transcript_5808/m.5260 type:complete len:198 (-) Transcript_5808:41-634(-)
MTECIVDCPILYLISLICETDLFPTWMPNITFCQTKIRYSDFRNIHEVVQRFPWPMSQRDIVLRVSASYNKERNAVLSFLKSLKEEKFMDYELKQPGYGTVRMDMKKGYHYLEYLGPNTTKYVTIMNVDPQLSYIPQWVINYIMTSVCYEEMGVIQRASQSITNSIWAQRIKEKQYLYGEVEEVISKLDEQAKASKE